MKWNSSVLWNSRLIQSNKIPYWLSWPSAESVGSISAVNNGLGSLPAYSQSGDLFKNVCSMGGDTCRFTFNFVFSDFHGVTEICKKSCWFGPVCSCDAPSVSVFTASLHAASVPVELAIKGWDVLGPVCCSSCFSCFQKNWGLPHPGVYSGISNQRVIKIGLQVPESVYRGKTLIALSSFTCLLVVSLEDHFGDHLYSFILLKTLVSFKVLY